MSLAANKALVRQYYETLWNRWEIPLVDQLIADDIEFRGSLGTQVRGRAGFIGYMQSVRAAFPDFHNAIEQMIAEVDTVVARMSYEGTHRGALFGIAPSGRRVRYAGVAIFHIAGSKIARGWVLGDTASLRAQLEPAEHKG